VVRIGIHLGDVARQGEDILGDAVNIASRIEPLADPGGICVSEQVFDQVRNKTKRPLLRLGRKELKGVQFPVGVFRVVMPWEHPSPYQAVVAAGDERRIVVLPLANLSVDPKDEYFADGLTEELISSLSKIGRLKVTSRTSAMCYRGTTKSLREIAGELGVTSALEGSVRKSDDDLRISVQLVDAASDALLWSEDYDRKMKNIFAIQREIAGEVSTALKARLLEREAQLIESAESQDPHAYSYYLRGRQLAAANSEAPLRQAAEMMGKAVELEPSFARAHVGLAECHLALGNFGFEPFAGAVRKAEAAISRAFEINRDLPEAHSVLALIRVAEDRLDESESEAKKAIELSPSLAEAHMNLAEVKAIKGETQEAVKLLETAYQLDPLAPRVIGFLGHMYFYAGREADALAHWSRTLELAPYQNYSNMAEFYIAKGDGKQAAACIAMLEKLRPQAPRTLMWAGYKAALDGRKAQATEMLKTLEQTSKKGAVTVTETGVVWFALGNRDAFFDCMFQALKIHALSAVLLRYSPLFKEARSDPRFRDLFSKLGVSV
jgi:adenylate cyclase